MSEATFTKGPWSVVNASVSGHCCFEQSVVVGDLLVCELWSGDANSNLIAAAPEMYELLERLVNPDNCKKDIIHIIGNAESLLAKAKGETK